MYLISVASKLEHVEPLTDYLGEFGADNNAVQIRSLATLVTNTEKQTAQSAMDEEAVRDLVGEIGTAGR